MMDNLRSVGWNKAVKINKKYFDSIWWKKVKEDKEDKSNKKEKKKIK